LDLSHEYLLDLESLSSDEVPSSRNSTGAIEEDDSEDDTITIKYARETFLVEVLTTFLSDVLSLKQGVIKTARNQAKAPYTILLLGETGVGKSSALELIANVLTGNDIDHYDFNILDHSNERGGSNNQSQTNSARIYELTSSNGIMVSPGVCERDGSV
jgi:putative ribosome biogenesis GTPase RsgA